MDFACRSWWGFVGFADWASRSFASFRLCRLGVCFQVVFTCPPWRDFSGFAKPQPCRSGHRAQLGGARPAHEAALRKRLSSPLASRSALEKLCFSSALPTGSHPSMASRSALEKLRFCRLRRPGCLLSGCLYMPSLARLLRLCQTPALPFRPPSTARWRSACARSCAS